MSITLEQAFIGPHLWVGEDPSFRVWVVCSAMEWQDDRPGFWYESITAPIHRNWMTGYIIRNAPDLHAGELEEFLL